MRNNLVDQLRQAIERLTGCRRPRPERRFHRDDEYVNYGLRTPDFHALMRSFRPRFRALDLTDRLAWAERLLATGIGELGHAGIHLLALSTDELTPGRFETLDAAAGHFHSWSHVDHFCLDVIQPLLDRFPEPVLE
jgi:hypothetical protein